MFGLPPSAESAAATFCLACRERLLGGMGVVLRLVEIRLRRDALGEQVLLALQDLGLEVVVVLRGLQRGQRLLIGGAQLADLKARRGERRVGLVERDAVRLRVDAEQNVAGFLTA